MEQLSDAISEVTHSFNLLTLMNLINFLETSIYFYFIYLSVLPACMSVHHLDTTEEGTGSPGTELTDVCELPLVCVLTTEPSAQPLNNILTQSLTLWYKLALNFKVLPQLPKCWNYRLDVCYHTRKIMFLNFNCALKTQETK